MGDLTKCKSSEERAPSRAGGAGDGPGEPTDGEVNGEADPATIISGSVTCLGPTPEGFFKRIFKSPWEYSNSSRLCSVMKRSSCSICSISGFANGELAAGFEGFLGFMPLLDLNKIPRNAGEYFTSLGVHGHVVFDTNPPNARHIDAWFDRNHVSWN